MLQTFPFTFFVCMYIDIYTCSKHAKYKLYANKIPSRVTVLKDDARRSKGVAFIMFIEKESAIKAVRALNKTEV